MHKDNPQTHYRTELPGKILNTAMREFLHRGVKSVKMDDIANLLGISKRTLYEIYSNKEDLLLECVRLQEEENDRHMVEYSNVPNHSVIDIFIEFYKHQIEGVSNVSPAFFQDIHKYKTVMDFYEKKREVRNRDAKSFFLRGVKEGYFMRTELYKVYDMKHLLHNILFLFLRGVCTAEGIARLDTFIADNILQQ